MDLAFLDATFWSALELPGRDIAQIPHPLAEETVRLGLEMSMDEAMAYEASQFGLAASSQDYQEGMTAFLEKRKPDFKDC